ncbi:F-box-like domain superfamily [Sesbania bispinosa]|nr:F-box-like domain superfamily [Sesbania bispinosa]
MSFEGQRKMRKRAKKKKGIMMEDQMEESLDSINHLLNDVLIIILSMIPNEDVVKTSTLSKRCRSVWKKTSHLDFDVDHMINPLRRLSILP